MHGLALALTMLHIHGALAFTILKDAPIVYKDASYAYKAYKDAKLVVAAYERARARKKGSKK